MHTTDTFTAPPGGPYVVSDIQIEKNKLVYASQILVALKTVDSDALVLIDAPDDAVRVTAVSVKLGDKITEGTVVLEIERCDHAEQFAGLCLHCGIDTTKPHFSKTEDQPRLGRGAFSLVHGQPHLTVNAEVATTMEKEVVSKLIEQKKLSLVFDLDHTLVHATTAAEQYTDEPDTHKMSLPGDPNTYVVKLRPGVKLLLDNLSPYYQMYLYSMGTSPYVAAIASILDDTGLLFKDRILSRESAQARSSEAFLEKSLEDLFPFDWSMVAIVDDREDVWQAHLSNLMWVPPFQYFAVEEVNPVETELFRLPTVGRAAPPPVSDTDTDSDLSSLGAAGQAYRDMQLPIVRAVLHVIHTLYYGPVLKGEDSSGRRDVRCILDGLRRTVLDGTVLVFSGVIPTNLKTPPQQAPVWRIAEQFGAVVRERVDDDTTHVLAARDGSEKVKQANDMGAHVVTVSWLLDCVSTWNCIDADKYLLGAPNRADTPVDHELQAIYQEAYDRLFKKFIDFVERSSPDLSKWIGDGRKRVRSHSSEFGSDLDDV